MEIALGIILLALAVFLIVAGMFQQGGDDGLSGTIVGGNSDSFFGKGKESKKNKVLFIATAIASAVFGALILVMNIIVA